LPIINTKLVLATTSSGGNIEEIPEEIKFLPELKEISIFENKLTYLPESIGDLNNLRVLDITNNELTNLPKSIIFLEEIRKIKIIYNKLNSLPEFKENHLKNLNILNLSNNELTSIPESIENLTNLKKLNLNNNKLTSIPESIENLKNLKKLNLNNNRLNSLPMSIGNLLNLKNLEVNDNRLNSLPMSIGNLLKLQYLKVNNNSLTSFPDFIIGLPDIRLLDISNNKIDSLPESIGDLNNHGRFGLMLYMQGNNITHVPISIKKLFFHTILSADQNVMEIIENILYPDPNKMKRNPFSEDDLPHGFKESTKRKFNDENYNNEDEYTPKRKIQKIKARYFDSNKNKHIFEDVNEINNLSDKKCSYCKIEPIKSYNIYKNKRGDSEAHFICSQNCSDKIFHNIHN
jgi:Leucine-rich repeat (LRR) protein